MYTWEFLKEHDYHRLVGRQCDLLVSRSEGDRIVKTVQAFVREHTAPELQMKCGAAGLRKTGTKFELALRLWKAGALRKSADAPEEEEEAAFRSEVEALVRKRTLAQLREMCDTACVSSVGNKLGLATRLVRPKYTTDPTF